MNKLPGLINYGIQTFYWGETEPDIKSEFKKMDEKQFSKRLFAKDPYLWKSDSANIKSISNRLGWIDSIKLFLDRTDEITSFADEIKNKGFTHVVLLGMGGSSLCPEVMSKTFGSATGYPELIVLDNTDPAAVFEAENQVKLRSTLFIVASKSGTTTETSSFYKYFYDKLKSEKHEKAGENFIAITDPGSPLVEEANNKNFRRVFENPEDIGGRYSAISYFGLVPMALIGIDIKSLLGNTYQFQLDCNLFSNTEENPGVSLGIFLGVNQKKGKDKITFLISDSISSFGNWVEQLIAESTGKEGTGLIPIVDEPSVKTADYKKDRVFIFIYNSGDENKSIDKKISAVERSGHPAVKIELKDKLAIGAEFIRWELATATAGALMGVNPFDEPNVSESKKNTKDILNEWKKNKSFPPSEPEIKSAGLSIYFNKNDEWASELKTKNLRSFINKFIKSARYPDYFSLLLYFHSTSSREKILQSIRKKINKATYLATTIGFGPRYLHSTGQLHKGGPNTGLFIIITADSQPKADEPLAQSLNLHIPGEEFDFAVLQFAQALGDFRSLTNKNRRVIRIHFDDRLEEGLKKFEKIIK